MTPKQRGQAMSLDLLETVIGAKLEDLPEPETGPHGKVTGLRFEPYHDVMVYEDGYEEWFYIGD